MKARDDLANNISEIIIIPFDFDDWVDDGEVLSQYLWVLFDFLLMIDAASPHVFEAAVIGVVFIEDKVEDFFDIEDVEAVLNLLQVEPFHEV